MEIKSLGALYGSSRRRRISSEDGIFSNEKRVARLTAGES